MGDAIYNQAVKEMKSLAEHVMQDIQEFADEHDYEKTWVVERFREEFNRIMQDIQEFADEHDYEKTWVVERFREEFNRISRKEG